MSAISPITARDPLRQLAAHLAAAQNAKGPPVTKSSEYYGVDLATVDQGDWRRRAAERGCLAEFGPGMLGGTYLTLRWLPALRSGVR
ncbi:MAG: hypothetical protein U1A27_00160 [Phycisphaerae bacterium]